LLKPSAATLLFGFFWCRHYSKLIYLLLSLRLDLFARLAAMSIYADVQKGPAIEVFALTQAFKDDSNPSKVNLSVGGKWRIQFPPPEECSYIHTCAAMCVTTGCLCVRLNLLSFVSRPALAVRLPRPLAPWNARFRRPPIGPLCWRSFGSQSGILFRFFRPFCRDFMHAQVCAFQLEWS